MIEELLKQSMAEHVRAIGLRRSGKREEGKEALRHARDLRLQALSQDPEMADEAWKHEAVSHQDMMTFYALQLGD